MWLTVGIATSGRGHILGQAIHYLCLQDRQPDELIICSPAEADFGTAIPADAPFPIRRITAGLGLTKQRNAIVRAAGRSDVLLFLDDDFFPCASYIAEMVKVFESGAVAVATGTVLADGIKGPGISFDEAERIIRRENGVRPRAEIHPIRHGYGCNMALRYRPMVEHDLFFDENLPRYGWYEDVDLMRRLAAYGSVVRSTAAGAFTSAPRPGARAAGSSAIPKWPTRSTCTGRVPTTCRRRSSASSRTWPPTSPGPCIPRAISTGGAGCSATSSASGTCSSAGSIR